MKVSVIGLGFVGGAILKSFKLKGIDVVSYDKFKDSDGIEICMNTDVMFLCLPTQFDEKIAEYDKSSIFETCDFLEKNHYKGIVVIKSTVEPQTTGKLSKIYNNLKFVHNPEFLTASTAFEDFHNQKHVVLGKGDNVNDQMLNDLVCMYKNNYPDVDISICESIESESMKIYANCFYSVKIQFFNELYLLSKNTDCDYNKVVDLMLKNGWINPMHTKVPGSDGLLSYGGYCFPKDTNALMQCMKKHNSPCAVLEATINERNTMRDDAYNVNKQLIIRRNNKQKEQKKKRKKQHIRKGNDIK
jgi:UDPglucose 6-dehydrogenase